MAKPEVAGSAIWCRITTTGLLLAAGLAVSAAAYPEEANRVERTARKAAQGVEKTAKRAGKFVEKTATRAGKFAERTADKAEKAVKKLTE